MRSRLCLKWGLILPGHPQNNRNTVCPAQGQRPFTSKTRHQRGGYVLLVVLAASVLVITVLGTLAKISLRRAVDANDAERSLRQRWGALTLQQSLLQAAPKIFDAREKELAKVSTDQIPPPVIRQAITIGDVTFDILLGDEDAKLNLNVIYHQTGEGRTQRAISSIVGPNANATTRLLPAVPPQSRERKKQAFFFC